VCMREHYIDKHEQVNTFRVVLVARGIMVCSLDDVRIRWTWPTGSSQKRDTARTTADPLLPERSSIGEDAHRAAARYRAGWYRVRFTHCHTGHGHQGDRMALRAPSDNPNGIPLPARHDRIRRRPVLGGRNNELPRCRIIPDQHDGPNSRP